MEDSKETASYRHKGNHVNSQRLQQFPKDPYRFKLDKIPALRRINGQKAPPLTKKKFTIDACWEGENQFSLMEFHWIY